MKVFISWSGDRSKAFAIEFGPWLKDVLQNIRPFVSADDIDKGARWAAVVNRELGEAGFGIVCLTSDTIAAPWINFGAGALSRRFADSDDDPPVATLLLDSDDPGAIPQPLAQFNGTVATKDDVLRLLRSLNTAMGAEAGEGVDDDRLKRTFDQNWPRLEQAIETLRSTPIATPASKPDPSELVPAKVDEMLSILREMNRVGAPRARNSLPESAKRGFSNRVDDIFRRFMPTVQAYVLWGREDDRSPLVLSTGPAGEDLKEAIRAAGVRNDITPVFKTVNPGDTVSTLDGETVFVRGGVRPAATFSGEGTLAAGGLGHARQSSEAVATEVTEMMLRQEGLDVSSMRVVSANGEAVEIYVPHAIHHSVLQKVRGAVSTTTGIDTVRFFTRGADTEMRDIDPDDASER